MKVLPLSTGLLCNLVTLIWGSAEERKMCEELWGNSKRWRHDKLGRMRQTHSEKIYKTTQMNMPQYIDCSTHQIKFWYEILQKHWIYIYIKGSMMVSPWLFCSHSSSWSTSSPGWRELPGWRPAALCPRPCDAQFLVYNSIWHISIKVFATICDAVYNRFI